jgi:hypothetical protein
MPVFVISVFKQYISLLLGSYGPLGLILSCSIVASLRLNKNLMNGKLVKSLSLNSVNRTVNISYYSTHIGVSGNASFKVNDLMITNITSEKGGKNFYVLENDDEKFILPVDPSVCTINEKLLYEIFSNKNDPLVESVLLNNKHLLNFSCPMISNPSNTLDSLLRKNYLKEKGQLSGEDINEKNMMAISNEEISQYEEFKMNELKNSSPSTLGLVEELLAGNEVEKSREITEYVRNHYNVSNLEQFKNLGANEIVEIAKHLEIQTSDVNSFYQKLKNLI